MKLKEIFQFNEHLFYDSARVLKRAKNRRKKIIGLIVGSVFLSLTTLLVAIFFLLNALKQPDEKIVLEGARDIIESIESSEGELHAFPLNAHLKIKTNEDVSAAEMRARLQVSPNVDYNLKKTGKCSYQIKFDSLEPDSLYSLNAVYNNLKIDSWALQTEAPFSVISASPKEEGSDVGSIVEITFSHAEVEGFEDAFSIEPKVEGRFEHYGNTWGFIPSAPLEEGTFYSVTLNKSVMGPNGVGLSEDYSFDFKTDYGDSYAYLINGENGPADSFLINEPPVAAISWALVDISLAQVEIYSLDTADSYIEAYQKYIGCGVVSSGIMSFAKEPRYQFSVKPVPAENYGAFESAAFIQYPEALPKGYYFSKIEVGGKKLFQLFQITDLSVASLTTEDEYIIWVNDAVSGTSKADIKVDLEGFPSTKTTSSGVAILKDAKEDKSTRILKIGEKSPYVAMLRQEYAEGETQPEDYYYYISADAPIYRGGESVGLFGAVLPRSSKGTIPEKITLKSALFDEDLEIEPDENGAFSTTFELAEKVETASISVWVKEICLDTIELSIMDEAPSYNLSVSVDQRAYIVGQTVSFGGSVTDKNGAPVANAKITDGGDISVVTDPNGRFSGSLELPYDENAIFESVRIAELHLYLEEEPDIIAITKFLVLPSEYILETEYKEGILSIGAFVAYLDGASFLDSDTLRHGHFDKNVLKGETADISLYAELHELRFEKLETGETYDPVGRKIRTTWTYKEQDIIVEKYNINTENGIANLQLPEVDSGDKRYYINIYLDSDRSIPAAKVYLNERRYENEFSSGKTFELVASQTQCAIDDQVLFKICREEDHQVVGSGSVVYAVISNGIIDVSYSSSSRFSFDFKEEYAPDVWVYALYFDGSHCYSVGREYLAYQRENSLLKIDMELADQSVAPGREVTLHFKVTDPSGEPVAATLNISVLDRSIYLINDFSEPIDQLYRTRAVSSNVISFASHRDFSQMEEYGEGVGEAEDGLMRQCNYSDGFCFETIISDKNGEASLKLTLPQELVEWKVIAKAISKDGMAALDAFDLSPKKDLNTHIALPQTFDIDEKCKFSVMVDGENLNSSEHCEFMIGINDHAGKEIAKLKRQGILGHYVHVDVGVLPQGVYTLYVRSTAGYLEDNIIAFFNVENTMTPILVQEIKEGQEQLGFTLTPNNDGRSIITIVDQSMAIWPQALIHLAEAKGKQLDHFLARLMVDSYYKNGGKPDALPLVPNEYISGGLKSLPDHENTELKLSALVAAVAPGSVDREEMIPYFNAYLNHRYASTEDRLLAYLGLGSLGEPILLDLQYFYEQTITPSEKEAMLMAMAFAYSGDHQTARFIYQQFIEKFISGSDRLSYVIEGKTNHELTMLAALLTSKISAVECNGLVQYCVESKVDFYSLVLISYMTHYVGTDGEEIQVTVTMNGSAETYRFPRYAPLILVHEGDGEVRISGKTASITAVCGFFAASK